MQRNKGFRAAQCKAKQRNAAQSNAAMRHATQFNLKWDAWRSNVVNPPLPLTSPGRVVLIAASNRVAQLDPQLRRPGRLDREIEVGVPTPAARAAILRTKLARVCHLLSDAEVE